MSEIGVVGFDWDEGNVDKSFIKHGVKPSQSEEVFLDEFLLVLADTNHQQVEHRWMAIGSTFQGLLLFVVFTVRGQKVRVISARMANKKERVFYEANT